MIKPSEVARWKRSDTRSSPSVRCDRPATALRDCPCEPRARKGPGGVGGVGVHASDDRGGLGQPSPFSFRICGALVLSIVAVGKVMVLGTFSPLTILSA